MTNDETPSPKPEARKGSPLRRFRRRIVQRGWLGLLICLLIPLGCPDRSYAETVRADFFVSVNGNDGWSGRLAEANATRSDGPFATIAGARDAVRNLKKTSGKRSIVVRLRGGVYRLKETLVFSLEDSAPEGGTITYAAYHGEEAILSSAVPIKNWRPLEPSPPNLPAAANGKVWVAEMPAGLDSILTLYDGEERLPRARTEGFAPTNFVGKTSQADRVTFPLGALRNWPGLKAAELLVIPTADYEMSILPLASVDEQTGIATTAAPASRPIGKVKFFPISAWVENVLEALDQPGEWVVDPVQRRLFLWPPKGQPGENIIAPALTELLRVEGRIDYDGPKDQPVRGLVFQGLTFRHAERYQWHGYTGWSLQHHWEMFDRPTAALRFRGAELCAIQACRFTATSGAGLRLDLHCQRNRIVDNEISHAGGVGVLLAGYGPGTKDVNRQNEISNNWIHHTGEIHWAAPAIMIWQSGENHVANNLIHNTPYSGITVSTRAWLSSNPASDGSRTARPAEIGEREKFIDWQDRERFLHARKNLVERNEIHHVMEVMGDGDGIYISGTGGQNQIRNNYIHDCNSDHMADGIRCDDDQNEVVIEGNIIYHCRCVGQGICSKGKNHILNNIVADLLPSGLPIRPERITRGYIGLVVNPVTGSRIQHNIVFSPRKDYPLCVQNRIYGQGGEPRLRDCEADYNLYFCPEDGEWGRRHLEQEQPFGVETHSLSADPLFVDWAKGDLRLKPQSPALKLGFEPIDKTRIGLLPKHPWHRR